MSAGCNKVVVRLANLAGGFLVDALGIRSIFLLCASILLASFLLFCLTLRLGMPAASGPMKWPTIRWSKH